MTKKEKRKRKTIPDAINMSLGLNLDFPQLFACLGNVLCEKQTLF